MAASSSVPLPLFMESKQLASHDLLAQIRSINSEEKAQKVLTQYHLSHTPGEHTQGGVFISAEPLISGSNLTPSAAILLKSNEPVPLLVDGLRDNLNLTSTSDTFLIFNSEKTRSFTPNWKKVKKQYENNPFLTYIPSQTQRVNLKQEEIIGVGFSVSLEATDTLTQELFRKAVFLAINWKTPLFMYHPFFGLQFISNTVLLDLWNGFYSPLKVLDELMQKENIIWQESEMKPYDCLDPTKAIFSLKAILDNQSCDLTAPQCFYLSDSLIDGHIAWDNGQIPTIHLEGVVYLDRKAKIPLLIRQLQHTFIEEALDPLNNELKKVLSLMEFNFAREYKFTDLNFTYNEETQKLSYTYKKLPKCKRPKLFKMLRIAAYENPLSLDSSYQLLYELFMLSKDLSSYYYFYNMKKSPLSLDNLCHSLYLKKTWDDAQEFLDHYKKKPKSTSEDEAALLTLFFELYLTRCEHVPSPCKAEVTVALFNLFYAKLELPTLAQCLVWLMDKAHFECLSQLTKVAHATLLSRFSSFPGVSEKLETVLLNLKKIELKKEDTLPPSLLTHESKALTETLSPSSTSSSSVYDSQKPRPIFIIHPQRRPALPIPPPNLLEDKVERKENKIIWQGKELNKDTPLAFIIQYVLNEYYLIPYPGKPNQPINRPLHGGTHAIMTVLLIDLFKELFKEYLPEFLYDPQTKKILPDEDFTLIKLIALYHDSGNTTENEGAGTDQSPHAIHFKQDALKMGFPIEKVEKYYLAMLNKDNERDENIGKMLLQSADCLEYLRCCHKARYDLDKLNLFSMIKKYHPERSSVFKSKMEDILKYYKTQVSNRIYNTLLTFFENKELNLKTLLYEEMKKFLAYFRFMHAILRSSPQDNSSKFAHFRLNLTQQQLDSLSPYLFFSQDEIWDNVIINHYFPSTKKRRPRADEDEGDEVLDEKINPSVFKFTHFNEKLMGTVTPLKGFYFLRSLRHTGSPFTKEANIWETNRLTLKRENIVNLSSLKERYENKPLTDFFFRPAVYIEENLHVDARWSHYINILLRPANVSILGGYKKNVVSDLFTAKDFNLPDLFPPRVLLSLPDSCTVLPKIKTLHTLEAIRNKIQEMEDVRTGNYLACKDRYYGQSSLASNEILIYAETSLSEALEAIGICCNLKSPTWLFEITTVAQAILSLQDTFPPSARYFLYIPDYGQLFTLSLDHVRVLALGEGEKFLKYLFKNVDFFASFDLKFLPKKIKKLSDHVFKCRVENLKDRGSQCATAVMKDNVPYLILENKEHIFDAVGIFRQVAREYINQQCTRANTLLSHFYWELLFHFQVTEVQFIFEKRLEYDVLHISFRSHTEEEKLYPESIRARARKVLLWLGYTYEKDKLKEWDLSGYPQVFFNLKYPSALQKINQTLQIYKKHTLPLPYRQCFFWHEFPSHHKTILNYFKMLEEDIKKPWHIPRLLENLNKIIPVLPDMPPHAVIGLHALLFKEAVKHEWKLEDISPVSAQFLSLFQSHHSAAASAFLTLLCQHPSDLFLLKLFSSPAFGTIHWREQKVVGEKLYTTLSDLQANHPKENAMIILTRFLDLFSSTQIANILWSWIWAHKMDFTEFSVMQLTTLAKRLAPEEKETVIIKNVTMRDLLYQKREEKEIKSTENASTGTSFLNLFKKRPFPGDLDPLPSKRMTLLSVMVSS